MMPESDKHAKSKSASPQQGQQQKQDELPKTSKDATGEELTQELSYLRLDTSQVDNTREPRKSKESSDKGGMKLPSPIPSSNRRFSQQASRKGSISNVSMGSSGGKRKPSRERNRSGHILPVDLSRANEIPMGYTGPVNPRSSAHNRGRGYSTQQQRPNSWAPTYGGHFPQAHQRNNVGGAGPSGREYGRGVSPANRNRGDWQPGSSSLQLPGNYPSPVAVGPQNYPYVSPQVMPWMPQMPPMQLPMGDPGQSPYYPPPYAYPPMMYPNQSASLLQTLPTSVSFPYKIGDLVEVLTSDTKYYPATMVEVSDDQMKVKVVFQEDPGQQSFTVDSSTLRPFGTQ